MLSEADLNSFKPSLFAGHYNLLLGSGVSLDSTDQRHNPLRSAGDLAASLCVLKGVDASTPLSRVSLLLEKDETERYITIPHVNCRPGETVKRLTSFVWRTVFTLNVDDALEAAYEGASRAKQAVESLNYDTLYKTARTKSHLPIVHLHGFAREPDKGYVFSTTEYARVTRGGNAWMHVVSELMGSEPFIIAGTTLNESDLDYYLSTRTATSGRTNRGPSLFIEPFPNKITQNLCDRHGLVLVTAKLSDFLAWLVSTLGPPPSVSELVVPSIEGILPRSIAPETQIEFFSAFDLVRPAPPNPEGEVSPFHFGRAARWSDLECGVDVPTNDELEFGAKARNFIEGAKPSIKVLCAVSDPGGGKTTQVRRAAYDLAKEGRIVFCLQPKAAISPENLISILSAIDKPIVIVVDNLADQSPALRTVITTLHVKQPVVVIAADRDYRRDHIDRILGDLDITFLGMAEWRLEAYEQLLERLRRAGLLGASDAVHSPKKFARDLLGDSVAVATCRALNNFKPLDAILKSLWNDADVSARRSYTLAALGEHCYSGGILYPILESAHPNQGLRQQLKLDCPLPLTYAEDGDYVLPLHPVVADKLLHMLSRDKPEVLLEVFTALAKALSPYVNRSATIARTPEARLAAQLFSSERVVRPLLRKHADDFYAATREAWQWNARYWEQRALLTQSSDIDTAIQYARHAVAIEPHPFPWTTLASLLARKLEAASTGYDGLFNEIYGLLTQVFHREAARSWRPTPHPYAALFHATDAFLNKAGQLAPRQKAWITQQIGACASMFSRDTNLNELGSKILKKM